MKNSFFNYILSLIFIPRCAVCKERLGPGDDALCLHCRTKWESAKKHPCRLCGQSVSTCHCVSNSMLMYDMKMLVKLGHYDPRKPGQVVNQIVYQIKRANNKRLNHFLAKQISAAITSSLGNCEDWIVTYSPRRESEIKKYGYDQAKELARLISEELFAEFRTLFTVSRYAQEQKKLNASERLRNAEISFSIADDTDITGRNIIIIDDVTTSGATLGRCAQLLNIIGADKIAGAVIAVGLL